MNELKTFYCVKCGQVAFEKKTLAFAKVAVNATVCMA